MEREDGRSDDGQPESSSRADADDGVTVTTTAGRREVVVPLRLYKTITVFSTLIAVVAILTGFVLVDVATDRAQAPLEEINVGLALVGVGLIGFGSLTYAFSVRFRTAGMGNAKDDTDEHSDNG